MQAPQAQQPPAPVPTAAPPRTPPPSGVLALRVVGLVGTLSLVAALAAGLVAGFFEQRVRTDTAVPANVRSVDVDVSAGDVTVVAAAEGATGVTTTRRWSVREPRVTTTVSAGGTVSVRSECVGGLAWVGTCSADVVVRVPAGTVVRAVSSSGDVRVDGTSAQVTARTTSGDIRLVATSGAVSARTTAGDVTVEASRSTQVDASAATGDVRVVLDAVPDLVRARTSTGDVTVLVPPGPTTYRVTASTPVGDRTVEVPEDTSSTHLVDATTAVGDVKVATG